MDYPLRYGYKRRPFRTERMEFRAELRRHQRRYDRFMAGVLASIERANSARLVEWDRDMEIYMNRSEYG